MANIREDTSQLNSSIRLKSSNVGICKRYYHGSPTPSIKELRPSKDPRTGITGIFVSDKQFSPEMFSLMPERHKFSVNTKTRGGRFVGGEVRGKLPLREYGYVYEVQPQKGSVVERKPGRFFLTAPVKVVGVRVVTREEVIGRGWDVKSR